MSTDLRLIEEELRKRLRQGYRPRYDFESVCDHGLDWLALTKERFDLIVKEETERAAKLHHNKTQR